jgi:hypothetical protein
MDIELLHQERLLDWGRRLRLPDGALEALAEVARETAAEPALLDTFRAEHEQTALQGKWYWEPEDLPSDPGVRERLGERASLFYLLVYLAALPYAEEKYRRRGIDPEIFDANMADFRIWLEQAHAVHGDWRFDQFHWLWHHLSGKLIRLGRMQYMLGEFEGGVTALSARQAGSSGAPEVVLLADPGVPLREDGYAHGAGDRAPAGEPWLPLFQATPDGWRGHVVTPLGRAQPNPAFFPAADWEVVLQRGDTVLDMHIPRGDPFTPADCQDSLRQAFDFFARQAPERPFRAGYCHTWFFAPQLQQLLPPESNIVRFQREFYLYPFAGKLSFLWEYVFSGKYPTPAGAPRDTRLRRAVLDWLEAGGEIFDLPGLTFHGPDAWGEQPYMRGWERKPD